MSARSILSTGTPLSGTLVGMRVWETGGGEDSPVILNLAWAVESAGTTYGVYQRLNPLNHVRLGMPVDLRVDGSKAVIDWGTERGENWKAWKVVPPRGIADERKIARLGGVREQWLPATVVIAGRRDRKALFGLLNASDAAATVRMGDATWPVDLRKRSAPFYATHLFDEGIDIPAWVNPGDRNQVFLDWWLGVERNPGIGMPPSALQLTTESLGFVDKLMQPKVAPAKAAPEIAPGERALGAKGEVTWDTFIAVTQVIVRDSIPEGEASALAETFGVPAGTWPEVQKHWVGKMKWNPKLGFQYGQALNAVIPDGWRPPVDNPPS